MSKNLALVESDTNAYWKAVRYHNAKDKTNQDTLKNCIFHGEILPCQDLKYGLTDIQFRIFDIRHNFNWMDWEDVITICDSLSFPIVPELYRGAYDPSILTQYTDGKECVSGKQLHIREGIVIKPMKNRYDHKMNRIIAKSVSNDYHTRKNGTEYN